MFDSKIAEELKCNTEKSKGHEWAKLEKILRDHI